MFLSVARRVLGLLRGPTFERFRAALVWNIVASVATQGGAFVANLVTARILGRETYGAFAIVLSTMLTVAGVAQLATGFTATKFVAEFAVADPARAGRVLGLCHLVAIATGLAASLGLLLGAQPLAVHVLLIPALTPQLAITAGFVFFAVVAGVLQGALVGLHAFRLVAIASIIQGALHVALCWGGALAFGLTGAVSAMALGAVGRWALGLALLVRVCRQRGVPMGVRGSAQERSVLFGFAIPAALGGFSSLPALWAGNAILMSQGGKLAEMAYFGAAMNLRSLILFVPTVVDGVSGALINRARSARDGQGYRQVFNLSLTTTGAVAGTVTIVTLLLARPLMSLFGAQFVPGADILRVLAIATCVQALVLPFYQLVQSQGRMWFSLLGIVIPRDLLMVALAIFLAPRNGALGLAYAQLLAWLLALVTVYAAAGNGGRIAAATRA